MWQSEPGPCLESEWFTDQCVRAINLDNVLTGTLQCSLAGIRARGRAPSGAEKGSNVPELVSGHHACMWKSRCLPCKACLASAATATAWLHQQMPAKTARRCPTRHSRAWQSVLRSAGRRPGGSPLIDTMPALKLPHPWTRRGHSPSRPSPTRNAGQAVGDACFTHAFPPKTKPRAGNMMGPARGHSLASIAACIATRPATSAPLAHGWWGP